MSFFDLFAPETVARGIQNDAAKLAFAKALSEQSARSQLMGGFDPLAANGGRADDGSSIIWNAPAAPSGMGTYIGADNQAQRMPISQMRSLMANEGAALPGAPQGAQPDQAMNPGMKYAQVSVPRSLLADEIPQGGGLLGDFTPQAYAQKQQALLRQADPDAALKHDQALQAAAPMLAALPERERFLAMANLPEYAKRKIDIALPAPNADLQLVDGLAAKIRALGGADNPAAKIYADMLAKLTENAAGDSVKETARHNRAAESLTTSEHKTDAFGNPIIFHQDPGQVTAPDGTPLPGGASGTSAMGPSAIGPSAMGPSAMGPRAIGPSAPGPSAMGPSAMGPDGQARRGDEPLVAVPQNVQGTVKSMIEGRIQPPSSFALKTPYWQQMLHLAEQADPDFDATKWAARNKTVLSFSGDGPDAQTVAALDQAIGDLGAFDAAGKGLNNLSVPVIGDAVNHVKNAVSRASDNPALDTFIRARQGVSTALAKVYKGTGSTDLSDIDDWKSTYSPDAGPKRLAEMAPATIKMIDSRIDSLEQKWKGTMGDKPMPPVMSPKAQQIYNRLSQGKGQYATGDGTQPSPAATPPLAPGSYNWTPDKGLYR